MNILVLNGSPKGEGSDTLHMTRAFLAGMNSVSENSVELIHVIDKHIEYCRGCFTCKRNGGHCVLDDDMGEILNQILAADLLVWSFPLYCYAMPAHLKALADRTMPLSSMAMEKVGDRYEHPGQYDFSHLRYVMISGCGFPNSRHNFEGMTAQFRLMFGEESTVITVPEAPMFNAPEAAAVTGPFLKLLEQAGREYAESGAVSAATMEKLSVPMIPEDIYAKICNGEA